MCTRELGVSGASHVPHRENVAAKKTWSIDLVVACIVRTQISTPGSHSNPLSYTLI